jgi:hypothetical protein
MIGRREAEGGGRVGWYTVIKTIKGHRYEYLQRTWREGRKVRTESRYLGPVDPAAGLRPARASDFDGVITTPRTLYHGTPEELRGALEPSEKGTFGPGFYLTSQARAALYARYDPRIAAGMLEGEEGTAPEPQYDGTVYAFDVSGLRLKALRHERYQRMCMVLDPDGAPTPSAKATLQELLAAEGYDGLHILSDERHEMVVFPGSLHKIRVLDS